MKKFAIIGLFILTLGLVGCEGKSSASDTSNSKGNSEKVEVVAEQNEVQEPLRIVEQDEVQELAIDILRYHNVISAQVASGSSNEEKWSHIKKLMSTIKSKLSNYDNEDLLNSNEELKIVYNLGMVVCNFDEHLISDEDIFSENMAKGIYGSFCQNENGHKDRFKECFNAKSTLTELIKKYDENFILDTSELKNY